MIRYDNAESIRDVIIGIQRKNPRETQEALEKWLGTDAKRVYVDQKAIARAIQHLCEYNISAQGVAITCDDREEFNNPNTQPIYVADVYFSPPPPIRKLQPELQIIGNYLAFFKITPYDPENPLANIDAPWIAVPYPGGQIEQTIRRTARAIYRGIGYYCANQFLGPVFYHNRQNPEPLTPHNAIYEIQRQSQGHHEIGSVMKPLRPIIDTLSSGARNAYNTMTDYIMTILGPICDNTQQKPNKDNTADKTTKVNNTSTYILVTIRRLQAPILRLNMQSNQLEPLIPAEYMHVFGEWHERMVTSDQIDKNSQIQTRASEAEMDDVFEQLGLMKKGSIITKTWDYFNNPQHYTAGLVIMEQN